MREIWLETLRNMRSSGAMFCDNIGIKLKIQNTSCEKSGLETLRNIKSSGAIFSDNIGIQLKTQRTCEKSSLETLRNMRFSGATFSDDIGIQIKTKKTSLGLNNYPAAPGLKCKFIIWQEGFKGIDAKRIGCVIPVILQILCDAKT